MRAEAAGGEAEAGGVTSQASEIGDIVGVLEAWEDTAWRRREC
jgi:hypothetical protein